MRVISFLFIYDPPSSPPCSFLSVLTFLGEAMNQEIQNLTVRPGGSVTLQTGLSGLNGEHILWMYGSNKMLLFCDERDISGPPEEYAGRLQLNQSSGCLTISNIRKSAVYRGEMLKENKKLMFDYNVTVVGEC